MRIYRTRLSGNPLSTCSRLRTTAARLLSSSPSLRSNSNARARMSRTPETRSLRCNRIHISRSSRRRAGLVPYVRIPRLWHACCNSAVLSSSTPSARIAWSSRRICNSRDRMAPRKKLSVPNALRPMYRHIEVSCGRERLSSVRSSSKSLATLIISSVDGDSPVERTLGEFLLAWMWRKL
jgi:hypothetical protein